MNIFLVPAHEDNIDNSISNPVSWDFLKKYLEYFQVSKIKESYSVQEPVHCWAMTENRKSVFSQMQTGDFVLITIKGTGKFNYSGMLALPIECPPEFGRALWPFTPNEPWTLVYFIKNVVPLNIKKKRLVTELGYSPRYQVPGVIRVRPEKTRKLIRSYGSIPRALEAIQSHP